jgi:murein DD-endopeptidase MepM/ murein hydrolase activator NlpD
MSYDFKMPMGTPILAVDDGRVFFVVEQFRDDIDQGFDEANLIGIEHSGGVLTWYMHLMFNGSLVQVDGQVVQGEVIGYSGNTGDSAYPHLHFSAQQIIDACHDAQTRTAKLELCPQLPISFSNVNPADAVLKEWTRYTALSY